MGLAKASLEASVRYSPPAWGPRAAGKRHFRRPDQDAGSVGHQGFGKILDVVATNAPLRRNVTIDDVAMCGLLAVGPGGGRDFGITYVDGGFSHAMAVDRTSRPDRPLRNEIGPHRGRFSIHALTASATPRAASADIPLR